jgi:hypothetical protein
MHRSCSERTASARAAEAPALSMREVRVLGEWMGQKSCCLATLQAGKPRSHICEAADSTTRLEVTVLQWSTHHRSNGMCLLGWEPRTSSQWMRLHVCVHCECSSQATMLGRCLATSIIPARVRRTCGPDVCSTQVPVQAWNCRWGTQGLQQDSVCTQTCGELIRRMKRKLRSKTNSTQYELQSCTFGRAKQRPDVQDE